MRPILLRLIPFLFLGVMIVIFIAGIIIFSYLLIFGALVGLGLFIVAWLKELFFPSKHMVKHQPQHKRGQTFDHKDD